MTAQVRRSARVFLRHRNLSCVLDLGVLFFAQEAKPLLLLSLLVAVPGALATYAIGQLAGQWLAWTFAFVAGGLAQLPFTVFLGRSVFEASPKLRDVLRASVKLVPQALVLSVIETVSLVCALSLFGLPALGVRTARVVGRGSVCLEQLSLGAALSRSQRLGQSGLSEAMPAALLMATMHLSAVFFADYVGAQALSGLFGFDVRPQVLSEGGGLLASLGYWGFCVYAAIARFFLYLNARTRTEGWDVQARFVGLGARGAAL
jgi:hypothetical protein